MLCTCTRGARQTVTQGPRIVPPPRGGGGGCLDTHPPKISKPPPPPSRRPPTKQIPGPEAVGQGERETQGEVTGQGRPRSPKTVQSTEGGKRERIIVVARSPCQENYPADAHPSAHQSVLESANPAWTRSVHLDAPGQRHGQQPVSGTADPGVVKQDNSSRGSVDTTKTR